MPSVILEQRDNIPCSLLFHLLIYFLSAYLCIFLIIYAYLFSTFSIARTFIAARKVGDTQTHRHTSIPIHLTLIVLVSDYILFVDMNGTHFKLQNDHKLYYRKMFSQTFYEKGKHIDLELQN